MTVKITHEMLDLEPKPVVHIILPPEVLGKINQFDISVQHIEGVSYGIIYRGVLLHKFQLLEDAKETKIDGSFLADAILRRKAETAELQG